MIKSVSLHSYVKDDETGDLKGSYELLSHMTSKMQNLFSSLYLCEQKISKIIIIFMKSDNIRWLWVCIFIFRIDYRL